MPKPRVRDRQGPAKAAAWLGATIIIIGGLFLFVPFLVLQKRYPVAWVVDTQTPNALIRITQFRLNPHQSACLNSVTVTPNSVLARFQPHPLSGAGGPPIDLLITAPGYRTVGRLPGGYAGSNSESGAQREPENGGEKTEGAEHKEERELTERAKKGQPREGGEEGAYGEKVSPLTPRRHVAITPPPTAVIGTACFIDAGTTPVLLDGTSEPRFTGRSTMTINGKPVAGTIGLTFFAKRPRPRVAHLGEIFAHASNLTDRLIPVWLIWILVVVALLALPTAIVAAFYRGLREDEAAT